MAARDDYDTALQAVVTAIEAADWETAKTKLAVAETHLHRLELSEGKNGASQTRRVSLKDLREHVAALQASSSGGMYERHSRWVP